MDLWRVPEKMRTVCVKTAPSECSDLSTKISQGPSPESGEGE